MTYGISAWAFARALGLIYVIAFVSLALEARGLWGPRGVLPIDDFVAEAGASLGSSRFAQLPTLFWWVKADDAWLIGVALMGALSAALAAVGFATGPMLLISFVLYLSFVTAGQDFMSFQWDILLLEVGFLALFAVPWGLRWSPWAAPEPSALVRYGFYGVLFKLMFLSGAVKLLSGDPAWRDLTALQFHYWTQPLPNPLSPFVHALPDWSHLLATLLTFVVELILPFLLAWPMARGYVAVAFGLLSVVILLTGNYTFFNWLTLALCLWAVPDAWWGEWPTKLGLVTDATPATTGWVTGAVMVTLYVANIGWCVRNFAPAAVNAVFTPLLRPLQMLHLSNSYGLFATMTKTRPEIVIEGSADGVAWREYVFKYKPGPLDRRPPQIAPLQPRLDWQMWFAALGSFRQNVFVANLLARLFEGSPSVLGFFTSNPFPDEPPRWLRARLYEYEFRAPAQIWTTGDWWSRRLLGEYSPTFGRR